MLITRGDLAIRLAATLNNSLKRTFTMPIRIPDGLPAAETLEQEGVQLLKETDARKQDIRPLQIALLNLMPNKIRTETQLARLIGASPLQVELTLVRIGSHKSKNTTQDHLLDFYNTWDEVKHRKFDGFIITGAPIETLAFEDVTYWNELTEILEWTKTNVHSLLNVCWGAMAAINYFHGVQKYELEKKAFGVFRHKNLAPTSPYLSGFSDDFSIPISRWTEVRSEDIAPESGLKILMDSEETGPCLIQENDCNRLYIFNHIEYDSFSLAEEYQRDISKGELVEIPRNYFPFNNPENVPQNRWRSHAHLLFGNWINQTYQTTPFNIDEIGNR